MFEKFPFPSRTYLENFFFNSFSFSNFLNSEFKFREKIWIKKEFKVEGKFYFFSRTWNIFWTTYFFGFWINFPHSSNLVTFSLSQTLNFSGSSFPSDLDFFFYSISYSLNLKFFNSKKNWKRWSREKILQVQEENYASPREMKVKRNTKS